MKIKTGLFQVSSAPIALLFLFIFFTSSFALFPVTAQAEIVTNVDDRVDVRFGWIRYDRHEQGFKTWVKVKNVSSAEIQSPIRIVITRFENERYSLGNADGITSNGAYYVDIDLESSSLGVGETSGWTRLLIKKAFKSHRQGWSKHDNGHHYGWHKAKHKARHIEHWRRHWRHHRFPIKFDFEMLGGTAVAPSAPTSFPYALTPGTGDSDVLFRVNLLSEGPAAPAGVLLRNLTSGDETEMNDDGLNGDLLAGDGIYVASRSIDTDVLAAGDCLTYVGVTTSSDGFEIVSSGYDLCASNLPQVIGESNTAPDNQTPVNGVPAVGDELLVVLQPGFNESALQQVLKDNGGVIIGTSPPNGLYQVKLPGTLTEAQLSQLIADFAAVDGVGNAGPNYIGAYTTTPSDALYGTQHGLQLVSADDLGAAVPQYIWDANALGSGFTVTLLDSGVDASHPDLLGKVVAEKSPGANTDTLGHGTEMAGIIAANTDNAVGVAGIARNANIESIKVSAVAAIPVANMVQGFTDAASPLYAGQIVHASFSVSGLLLPPLGMCGAIDNLIAGGAVVIASAGNDGSSTDNKWPGNCNNSALDGLISSVDSIISSPNKNHFIVVGASNCSSGACATDSRKSDSNFGSWVDIGAPGVNLPTTTIATVDATLYTSSNGTSGAAALVSGAAAVLRSCGVAANQVFNALDLGASVAVTGDFNRINLYDALAPLNTSPTGIALSNNMIDENVNTTGGSAIGNLSTTDATACDSHTYSITGGVDAARFSVSGNQLLLDDGVLDFETRSSYAVTVTSTDFYGLTTSQAFTVNVNDLVEGASSSIDFDTRQDGTPYTGLGDTFAANEYDGLSIQGNDPIPGFTSVDQVNPVNVGTAISGYHVRVGAFASTPATQLDLNFTTAVSSLSFDFGSPTGGIVVEAFNASSTSLGIFPFVGTGVFTNQAGFPILTGSAVLTGIGSISSVVIRPNLPNEGLLFDNLAFTTP